MNKHADNQSLAQNCTMGGPYGVAHGLANAVILPIIPGDYIQSGSKTAADKPARLFELCGVSRGEDKEANPGCPVPVIEKIREIARG